MKTKTLKEATTLGKPEDANWSRKILELQMFSEVYNEKCPSENWGVYNTTKKHHNLRENKITSKLFGPFKNDSRISERRSKFLDKVIKTH